MKAEYQGNEGFLQRDSAEHNSYLMHDNISGYFMTASGGLYFKDVKVS